MNKANIFMNAGWVGLGGLGLAVVGHLFESASSLGTIGMLAAVAACMAMLATRNADEFTFGLWSAGASVAFGTMLLIFLGLPFAEGVFDGLTGAERKQDIPASAVPALTILAFYVGLFVKRLLGDA